MILFFLKNFLEKFQVLDKNGVDLSIKPLDSSRQWVVKWMNLEKFSNRFITELSTIVWNIFCENAKSLWSNLLKRQKYLLLILQLEWFVKFQKWSMKYQWEYFWRVLKVSLLRAYLGSISFFDMFHMNWYSGQSFSLWANNNSELFSCIS